MIGRVIIQLLLLGLIAYFAYLTLRGLPQGSLTLPGLNITIPQIAIPQNLSYPTTVLPNNTVPQNETIAYVLALINKDRSQYGLANVSISNITSGQQHANSMLTQDYFSHWDLYGMKPYMRYTLLGGRGSVDENVAYRYQSNGANVLTSLQTMEYGMMYNDSVCCNNGHRDNILDPNHNQVSIGVAYNKTTVYLVEDFIDNYIGWLYNTPSYSNGDTVLKGSIQRGYAISTIDVVYDQPVINMTSATVPRTPYGFGNNVACIGHTAGLVRYYCTQVATVNASVYTVQGQNFDIEFNLANIVKHYGAGEYSLLVFLNNTSTGTNFIGSTYTIFINNSDQPYTPSNV